MYGNFFTIILAFLLPYFCAPTSLFYRLRIGLFLAPFVIAIESSLSSRQSSKQKVDVFKFINKRVEFGSSSSSVDLFSQLQHPMASPIRWSTRPTRLWIAYYQHAMRCYTVSMQCAALLSSCDALLYYQLAMRCYTISLRCGAILSACDAVLYY